MRQLDGWLQRLGASEVLRVTFHENEYFEMEAAIHDQLHIKIMPSAMATSLQAGPWRA
jgi:hypothetical protein